MSYGWLTESSILPNKSKKIDVQSKTVINPNNRLSSFLLFLFTEIKQILHIKFIDLKVNLLKDKEKLKLNTNNSNNNLLGKNHERMQIIKKTKVLKYNHTIFIRYCSYCFYF